MKSAYITDSMIMSEGTGGGVVSFHELEALKSVSTPQIYQHLPNLKLEQAYPNNPFMYDYFITSLIENPDEIQLAHFYGSRFPLSISRLSHAVKFATVPAHDLELSLEEWGKFPYWQLPPPHLTDATLFEFLCSGLKQVHIICPSHRSAEYIKRRFGLDSTIIPHGTNIPEEWNTKREYFRVFHLSQFGPDKGQIYLLDAWRQLQDLQAELTLCCLGMPDTIIKDLSNIILHSYISKSEKELHYRMASVYVVPSVTEGWGLSVGEAMSYGTPVITTEGAGASDMIVDGWNGFVVPIRDSTAIAEKLRFFYDNPDEVRRMGNNARHTAEKYAWNIIEAKYAKLYSEATL